MRVDSLDNRYETISRLRPVDFDMTEQDGQGDDIEGCFQAGMEERDGLDYSNGFQ